MAGEYLSEADALAKGLAKTRGGAGAGELARRLLDAQPDIVGILDDGRVVYWDRKNWAIAATPIENGRFDGLESTRIGTARRIGHLDEFVRDQVDAWAWVHPRYRWVLPEN